MKRLILTLTLVTSFSLSVFAIDRSQIVVSINGEKFYVHTVLDGETLYSLAKCYEVSEQTIIDHNDSLSEGLKSGDNIKIPYVVEQSEPSDKKESAFSRWKHRLKFATHTVAAGETLYSISRQYEISIETIIEDNPAIDPASLYVGQEIFINKKMRGKSDEAHSQDEWDEYRDNLNMVAPEGYTYHIVEGGETIYSLAKQSNMSEEEFVELNNLEGGLKSGAIIMLPIEGYVAQGDESEGDDVFEVQKAEFKPLRHYDTLRVSLLLPLSVDGKANSSFVSFYNGFKMGLEAVKAQYGRNIELTLFDTKRDSLAMAQIVQDPLFEASNLIVGPIYEESLAPILEYAQTNNIPLVFPLAVTKETQSNVLFQVAPLNESKYAKIDDLLSDLKHVTLIYTSKTDEEYEAEILDLLGDRPYAKHTYYYEHPTVIAERAARNGGVSKSASDLTSIINNGKDNTIVIMSNNETDVDRVLSALASAQVGVVSRGAKAPTFSVLGNNAWSRYNNIDRSVFFKDQVIFFSNYHAKRDSRVIKMFDSDYIKRYYQTPSLFAYRGYDVAYIFGEGLFSDIQYNMEGRTFTPLQSKYRFETDSQSGIHINTEWVRVNYNDDFTIIIE